MAASGRWAGEVLPEADHDFRRRRLRDRESAESVKDGRARDPAEGEPNRRPSTVVVRGPESCPVFAGAFSRSPLMVIR
ncbi:hypothetical protein SAMN04489732_124102 [Amycolatopsis saalfeldensis]|uniref:Uncharacterized protein n=1 Tax=Amycolatopsis saalfeldensis TaxID=394193 RepID=A0A1H8YMB1_9PSEU|nr:hypothetical protein SAMN04489732_124102 [Amycolatopsis saalfeldensis]